LGALLQMKAAELEESRFVIVKLSDGVTALDKDFLLNRALEEMRQSGNRTIEFKVSLQIAISLIGQIQLALRHPANTGPTRFLIEQFARDKIVEIDPQKGAIYELMMRGFDEAFDL
jgi:hypothetical protein